ncbi:MAG: signal recognition particle protein, partial [Pseudomonadota bacterium]
MAQKMRKGQFDLEDLSQQLKQMQGLGGMSGLMGFMPGMGKMKKQLEAAGGMDDKLVKRQMAIISSMTAKERRNPKLLNASRKKRVAVGSGTTPQEINKLLKMHRQMSDMMKKMGRNPGMMGKLMGGLGGGMPGGMPAGALPDMSDAQLEQLGKAAMAQGKGAAPGSAPMPGLPGLPGLGGGPASGGLPGLPGLG